MPKHLFSLGVEIGEKLTLGSYGAGACSGHEAGNGQLGCAAFLRAAFRHPLAQAAVQNGGIRSVQAADEPGPCRGASRGVVVEHDPVALGDAEFGHAAGELLGRRDGGWDLAVGVGDSGEVKEPGARYVPCGEFRPRIARRVEHVGRGVEHHQARLAEPVGQPCGGDEIIHPLWVAAG